ncbi:MAG TPA: hypothetical protein VH163_10065 [Gemmatimonadales bacterium]|jgi:hypothetical protein|nr:hypothetical protein [Gemmatimonadales bacterium]
MAVQKLSAGQQRRVDQIHDLQKIISHARADLKELESSRAAKASVINNLCAMIAREMSQMRQKLLTSPVGTVGDLCGNLSVVAGRSAGLNVKIRALNDGFNSIDMQIDVALKNAMQPEKDNKPPQNEPGDQPAH